MFTSSNRSALCLHRKRPGHRRDQKRDYFCPLSILSSAILSVVVGEKYRCCNGFCSTVAKRGQHEWPTKGCWRSSTMTASATFYTCDVAVSYQRHNSGCSCRLQTAASPCARGSIADRAHAKCLDALWPIRAPAFHLRQSERHSSAAPIRTRELSSRLAGQRRILTHVGASRSCGVFESNHCTFDVQLA